MNFGPDDKHWQHRLSPNPSIGPSPNPSIGSSSRVSVAMFDDIDSVAGVGGATAAQKTLSSLGAMTLFRGAAEARLNVHDSQLKTLMKFRNTILQGDYISEVL